MKAMNQILSPACRRRLEIQGYLNFSDKDLLTHRLGIRFAYWVCITLASIGIVTENVGFILTVAVLAFVASFPPYHPVDYIYNHGIRHLLKRPKLPPRTKQGRFACGVATLWLLATAYLFANGKPILGFTLGFSLVCVGLLVSATDICIPSMIYNHLFKKGKQKTSWR